jgi:hypothetical protein
MLIVPLAVAVSFGLEESVTVIVIAAPGPLVAAVGVPLITPVEAFNVSPAGNVPDVTAKV